jgi:hypothetical protein
MAGHAELMPAPPLPRYPANEPIALAARSRRRHCGRTPDYAKHREIRGGSFSTRGEIEQVETRAKVRRGEALPVPLQPGDRGRWPKLANS